MAFTGFYDAISVGAAAKLFIFSIAAAFSDVWHPSFLSHNPSPNLVLILVLLFLAMLLATFNAVSICVTVFITEAARQIGAVMCIGCITCYTLILLLFGLNLVSLASPWLLVMLICLAMALLAHLILVQLSKLTDCPIFKLAMSGTMLVMAVLCVSLKHWLVADASAVWNAQLGNTSSARLGLFGFPQADSAVRILQAFVILSLAALLLLAGICLTAFLASRNWLGSAAWLALGDAAHSYACLALLSTSLLFQVFAAIAYASFTYYTNSMLAAICLADSALSLLYQLLANEVLPTL